MLTPNILEKLDELAAVFERHLIPLPQTTSLLIRNERKFDRVDTKLLKEAQKLNKKEKIGEVKKEYREKQRVGAITYKSYTIEFKKKLITQIRQEIQRSNECLSKIIRLKAKATGIHPKNITRWYHTKELKKKEGGRRALYPQMQIRLANFILNNPKMKRKHILRQAKQIMEDLKIPGRNEFNFSKGWYERFRERLNKKKVAKGARLDDVKLQAKSQFETKEEYDEVKKEEEVFFDDEKEFQGFDESSDEEDNVKFEEQLSDYSERDYDDAFNVKLSDSQEEQQQSHEVKQSLFFDQDEEQAKQSLNNSAFCLIEQEMKALAPIRQSLRNHA